MRQISIRELRSNMCTQLKDLPFEITKNGKIIGIMCTQPDYTGNKAGQSVHNNNRATKQQVADILRSKPKVTATKATSSMGGSFFNPQPKGGK